jgi:hypothetical protein
MDSVHVNRDDQGYVNEIVVTAEREARTPSMYETLLSRTGISSRTAGNLLLGGAERLGRWAPGRIHLEAMGAFAKGSGYGLAMASAGYDIYKNPTTRNAVVTVVSTTSGITLTVAVCGATGVVGCAAGAVGGGLWGVFGDKYGGKFYDYSGHVIDKVGDTIEEAIPSKDNALQNNSIPNEGDDFRDANIGGSKNNY